MSEQLKLMVGSEVATYKAAAVGYRVTDIAVGGDVVTVDVSSDGDALAFGPMNPYVWNNGYLQRASQVVSNPPAAVGDLLTNGTYIYKVISYDAITDKITIRARDGYNGTLPLTFNSGREYTFTRRNWNNEPVPIGLSPLAQYVDYAAWERATFAAVFGVAPLLTPKQKAALRIDDAIATIGPNATELLADIADRLVLGKEHGDFAPRTAAEWTKEAYAEDLDGIVYRAARSRSAA